MIELHRVEKDHIFVTGEIGINSNGSLKDAKKIIEMAVSCGCDAVKFQKRSPDICVSSSMKNKMIDTPWGYISYLEYKKKIEFSETDYKEIIEHCHSKNIEWYASTWDLPSQDFIKKFGPNYNKVASPLLTNKDLITKIAKEKKKTFISTGMSTLENIDDCVNIFRSYNCPFVLNHSVGIYPTPHSLINLNIIKTLKERYNCEVGYSGHESDVLPSIIAVTMGATYLERHITLDRTRWGSDQAASLEKRGLELLVRDANSIFRLYGDGKKQILKEEKIKLKTLKYW